MFMDEWTGELDADAHGSLINALGAVVPLLERSISITHAEQTTMRDLPA